MKLSEDKGGIMQNPLIMLKNSLFVDIHQLKFATVLPGYTIIPCCGLPVRLIVITHKHADLPSFRLPWVYHFT